MSLDIFGVRLTGERGFYKEGLEFRQGIGSLFRCTPQNPSVTLLYGDVRTSFLIKGRKSSRTVNGNRTRQFNFWCNNKKKNSKFLRSCNRTLRFVFRDLRFYRDGTGSCVCSGVTIPSGPVLIFWYWRSFLHNRIPFSTHPLQTKRVTLVTETLTTQKVM